MHPIIEIVSEYYEIEPEVLFVKTNTKPLPTYRIITWLMLWKWAGMDYPGIAELFDKHRTTIVCGITTAKDLFDVPDKWRDDLCKIDAKCEEYTEFVNTRRRTYLPAA